MPGELNNVTTADGYSDRATARAPSSVRVRIIVRNASVYYQLGYGGRGGAVSFDGAGLSAEKFLTPGGYPLDETEHPFDAIRFRSATPGKPAQITVDCIPNPARHG